MSLCQLVGKERGFSRFRLSQTWALSFSLWINTAVHKASSYGRKLNWNNHATEMMLHWICWQQDKLSIQLIRRPYYRNMATSKSVQRCTLSSRAWRIKVWGLCSDHWFHPTHRVNTRYVPLVYTKFPLKLDGQDLMRWVSLCHCFRLSTILTIIKLLDPTLYTQMRLRPARHSVFYNYKRQVNRDNSSFSSGRWVLCLVAI